MRHPKTRAWERQLSQLFNRIDVELEQKYGDLYPLHPARPRHGATANPSQSGLFNVNAAFTGGFGSEHGAGYLLDVDMVTLTHVPDDVELHILEDVVARLREELPSVFPGRELQVSREGHSFKIHGDLSLGQA